MATKAKPAGASGIHLGPDGEVSLLEAGGRRWVGLPARRFPTADGKIHYEPIIEFTTRKAHRNCEHAALKVVEAYLKARGEW